MDSERAQRIRDAGISRSTFYYRLNKGMTEEEALTAPRLTRNGTPASADIYRQAVEFGKKQGLVTDEEIPTINTFTRYRAAGLPSRLAVIAQAQVGVEVRQELYAHAKAVASDPDMSQELINNPGFNGGLLAILQHLDSLSHAQVVLMLSRLTRVVDENWEADTGEQ